MLNDLKSVQQVVNYNSPFMATSVTEQLDRHKLGTDYGRGLDEFLDPIVEDEFNEVTICFLAAFLDA